MWFNAAGAGVIVDELGQTTLNTGWNDSQIEILANGTVEVRVWDLPAVSLGTASFNAWHNVVLRYNAATQTLDGFLDGVQSTNVSNGARQTPYGNGYGLYYAFGAADSSNNLGNGAYLQGLIQNISIFNTALSNAQVASLFGGGNASPAPLTVTLGSSSPGGSFSYPNGVPISGGQVIVPPGVSSISVDYTDTVPGTPVLSVSAPGFASASQQETILPAPITTTPSTDIVVGRTLSAYYSGGIQNHQETITYTVYNESPDSETGVLLSDTLAPGVTLVERLAAARPERTESGLEPGHDCRDDWTSVTITVSLASSSILQLDTGATAYATLNARAISNSTPAATLRRAMSIPTCWPPRPMPTPLIPTSRKRRRRSIITPRTSSTSCTTTSATIRTPVRFAGPAARSGRAGNALDVASLGIALMRASGIPAQYVEGSLSYAQIAATHPLDVSGQLSDSRLHSLGDPDFGPGRRVPGADRDAEPFLVPVQRG